MKRLVFVVTVSLLLAMWILSAWEITQTARASSVPAGRQAIFRLIHLDGKSQIMEPDLQRGTLPVVVDYRRLGIDRDALPAPSAPILADPIELRRLIR
jgi:hypothetical protein